MATTFSRGFKVKLIGTGLEAGTWGTSTNENFKRVDQYLSGVATSFNVVSPNLPSTFSGNTLNWCLGDTTDAWEDGSEGRYRFVNFTGTHGADVTVKICGNTSAIQNTNRVYWVKNSLNDSRKIVLNGGSGTYTLQNGSTALIYSDASGNVGNILDDLQIGGIDFRNAASVITLKDDEANALAIKDDGNGYNYIHFDTQTSAVEHVALGSTNVDTRIESPKVDLRSTATTIYMKDTETSSLKFTEGYTGTPKDFITFDTTDNKTIIGQTLDIDTAEVNVGTQATDIVLMTDNAAALEFRETNTSGSRYLSFDTLTPKILASVELEVDGALDVNDAADFSGTADFSGALTATGTTVVHDLAVGDGSAIGVIQTNGDYGLQLETGSSPGSNILIQNGANGNVTIAPAGTGAVVVTGDSYVNLSSTVGTGGYGLFSNSGVLEVSNTNSDGWGQPYHAGMVSGEGGYFEGSTAYTGAATYTFDTSSLSISSGSNPSIVQVFLKRTDASSDLGYAQNDFVEVCSRTLYTNSSRGVMIWSSNTYVKVLVSSEINGLTTSGSESTFSAAGGWSFVVRAWK